MPKAAQESVFARRWDSPTRYVVRSRSRSKIAYVADLALWQCHCEDYMIRHAPHLREGKPHTEHACFHLSAASRQFIEDLLAGDSIKDTLFLRHLRPVFLRNNPLDFAHAIAQELDPQSTKQ